MKKTITFVVLALTLASCGKSPREKVTGLVFAIQRADFEGDREALGRLFIELEPYAADAEFGAKVRYWRGFSQWRRAFNGFNDSVSPGGLQRDLTQAVAEFEGALALDSAFTDARVAAGSSMGLLMFLYARNPGLAPEYDDPARRSEYLRRALTYMNEAEAQDPGNPRVLWVVGQVRWNLPPELGGGEENVFATYEKGLSAARERKGAAGDPLAPSWGEPELLMNLAYSYMARKTPDLAAAEENARAALALVPHWHYVRDILLPQIEAAQRKAGGAD